jgi:hypothetical protein
MSSINRNGIKDTFETNVIKKATSIIALIVSLRLKKILKNTPEIMIKEYPHHA